MSSPFWLGTSWKMNKTLNEAAEYARAVTSYAQGCDGDISFFLIPPFTALARVAQLAAGDGVLIGAQDVHWAEDGPYTGGISARMVADAGAAIAEVGHQERRREHGETDTVINAKVHRALEWHLRPLLCVGETEHDRAYGVTAETLARQLKVAMHRVPADRANRLMVAYEPAGSIGVGASAATVDQVSEAVLTIRTVLHGLYAEATSVVPVLYGGSVDVSNAERLARVPGLNGLFIGRAALAVEGFIAIADVIRETVSSQQTTTRGS